MLVVLLKGQERLWFSLLIGVTEKVGSFSEEKVIFRVGAIEVGVTLFMPKLFGLIWLGTSLVPMSYTVLMGCN
jgi:hypothetical protein